MIKSLDETISYYKKKYDLLKENKNNRFQMIEEAIKSKEEINCQ